MSTGRALFSNRQDKRGRFSVPLDTSQGTPKVLFGDSALAFKTALPGRVERRRVYADTSFRNSVLLSTGVAAPFVSQSSLPTPQRKRTAYPDTSFGTPKPLFEDETFAPAMCEWPRVERKREVYARGFRNSTLLDSQVTTPPVSKSLAERPTRRWVPASTALGTPKTLFSDAALAFKNPLDIRVPRRAIGSETSYYNSALLNTAPPPPFVNPLDFRINRRTIGLETSQSSPLALLTFDPGNPVFTQFPWPAPIEYRHLTLRSWDQQAFPENIPPAPPPPAPRIEIGDGVPRKRKEAKQEREEFIDEAIREVLKPASPAPQLPEPLKPVLEARPVVKKAPPPVPLSVPPVVETDDPDDPAIIEMLTKFFF